MRFYIHLDPIDHNVEDYFHRFGRAICFDLELSQLLKRMSAERCDAFGLIYYKFVHNVFSPPPFPCPPFTHVVECGRKGVI